MDPLAAYTMTRDQLIAQVADLEPEQLLAPVPALPGWSVRDAFAHVVGVTADIVAGRMEGAGTPPWTARQVADRAAREIGEICEEYAALAEPMAAWLGQVGDRGLFCVYDAWTHQQDVQGALDRPGVRDERIEFLLPHALETFDGRLREAQAPPVRISGEVVDRVIGGTEASVQLRSEDYEVMRLLFGRRSRVQIDRMQWDGDYGAALDHLHLFPFPEVNLVD